MVCVPIVNTLFGSPIASAMPSMMILSPRNTLNFTEELPQFNTRMLIAPAPREWLQHAQPPQQCTPGLNRSRALVYPAQSAQSRDTLQNTPRAYTLYFRHQGPEKLIRSRFPPLCFPGISSSRRLLRTQRPVAVLRRLRGPACFSERFLSLPALFSRHRLTLSLSWMRKASRFLERARISSLCHQLQLRFLQAFVRLDSH